MEEKTEEDTEAVEEEQEGYRNRGRRGDDNRIEEDTEEDTEDAEEEEEEHRR